MQKQITMKILIIGCGPIGLHCALHLISKNYTEVVILEQNTVVGSSIESWQDVLMFSPFSLNSTAEGLKVLTTPPPSPDSFLTGRQYIDMYLSPLASSPVLKDKIKYKSKVVSLSRGPFGKTQLGAARKKSRFRVVYQGGEREREFVDHFDLVLDCSGVLGNPCHSGPGGSLAVGEREAARRGLIKSCIPSMQEVGACRDRGLKVAVLGSGFSAASSLNRLVTAGVAVEWVTRRGGENPLYVRQPGDSLPQRDLLAKSGNSFQNKREGGLNHYGCFSIETIEIGGGDKLDIHLSPNEGNEGEGTVIRGVDLLYSNTGYRPNMDFTRELQIHYCYASEGPMSLAAALLSSSATASSDCLMAESVGAETLKSPESNFFILGNKSYGRSATFLLKLGFQQVDEMMSLL